MLDIARNDREEARKQVSDLVRTNSKVIRLLSLHNLLSNGGEEGSGEFDDSVPGDATRTALSGDRTTLSPTWSANLPKIELI